MANNVVREQQLKSVVSAAQSFSLDTQDNTLSIVIEALATAASLPSSVVASKTTPNLSISSWTKSATTYSTTITYDGDGTLSTTLGTISNSTLTITDADDVFSATITASEGTTYAATSLVFSRTVDYISSTTTPTQDVIVATITIEVDNGNATITYDGSDGALKYILFTETEVLDYNLEGVESGQTIIAFAEADDPVTAAVAVYTVE